MTTTSTPIAIHLAHLKLAKFLQKKYLKNQKIPKIITLLYTLYPPPPPLIKMDNFEIYLSQLREHGQNLQHKLTQQEKLTTTYKQENTLLTRQLTELSSRIQLQNQELAEFQQKDTEQNRLISDLINSVRQKNHQTKTQKIDQELQFSTAKTSIAENQVLLQKIQNLENEVKRLQKQEILNNKFKVAGQDLTVCFQQVSRSFRNLQLENKRLRRELGVSEEGEKGVESVVREEQQGQSGVEKEEQMQFKSYFQQDSFNIDDSEFHSIKLNKSTREQEQQEQQEIEDLDNDEMLVLSSGVNLTEAMF